MVKGWKRLTQITIDELERFRINVFRTLASRDTVQIHNGTSKISELVYIHLMNCDKRHWRKLSSIAPTRI